jgi:hypothetical protein
MHTIMTLPWGEIDLAAVVWTIPAGRMKGGGWIRQRKVI